MEEQELNWGWVMRIAWGVFWRWIAACMVAIFAVAGVVVAFSRGTGQSSQIHHPMATLGTVILWLAAFVWAFGASLRARHGKFRLVLVSAQDRLTAFD
jgi:hypothetical protein